MSVEKIDPLYSLWYKFQRIDALNIFLGTLPFLKMKSEKGR